MCRAHQTLQLFTPTKSASMTTLRRFTCDDLLRFNNVNFDLLTETYNASFYLGYLSNWPAYQLVAESPASRIMAYIIGKAEGRKELWHGHVSAVTVAPEYRRLGLAKLLMKDLEQISEDVYNGYFVDLFVRVSNVVAIAMYKKMGYVVYRQILNYYSGEEDAFDMRKALRRDPTKASMVPLKHPIHPDEMWAAASDSE